MATSWLDIATHTATTATRYWSDAVARRRHARSTCSTTSTRGCAPSRAGASRPGRCRTRSSPTSAIIAPARLLAARRVRGGADADPAAAGRPPLLHRRLQRAPEPGRRRARGRARPAVRDRVAGGDAGDGERLDRRLRRARCATRSRQIGGPVHLVGDCQGGWLAAIVAALDPELGRVADGRRGADRLPRRRPGRCSTTSRSPPHTRGALVPRDRRRPAAACCAAR